MEMELAQKIAEAREAKGLTQAHVADALDVTPQAVSGWERGESIPTTRNLLRLARLLDAPLGEAVPRNGKGSALQARHSDGAGGFQIPLLSKIQAGHWTAIVSEEGRLEPLEWLFAEKAHAREGVFALEIEGTSMLPEFSEGDRVVIDVNLTPLPGDFVVAKLENEEEATFKKYRPRGLGRDGDTIIDLVPLNPDWPILHISPESPGRVIGTMIEHRRYRRR